MPRYDDGMERIVGRRIRLELVWRSGRLWAVDMKLRNAPAETSAICTAWGACLQDRILAFEDGRFSGFPDMPLAWEQVSGFRRRILETLYRRVGYGRVITYGSLAEMAGKPGAARAVGAAVHANPWSLVVP